MQVHRASTVFGQVNFDLQVQQMGHATIRLANQLDHAPEKLVLHLPWFLRITSVTVNGKNVAPKDAALVLPIVTKKVELRWLVADEAVPQLNYEKSVVDYKAEYKCRYEDFVRTGK